MCFFKYTFNCPNSSLFCDLAPRSWVTEAAHISGGTSHRKSPRCPRKPANHGSMRRGWPCSHPSADRLELPPVARAGGHGIASSPGTARPAGTPEASVGTPATSPQKWTHSRGELQGHRPRNHHSSRAVFPLTLGFFPMQPAILKCLSCLRCTLLFENPARKRSLERHHIKSPAVHTIPLRKGKGRAQDGRRPNTHAQGLVSGAYRRAYTSVREDRSRTL